MARANASSDSRGRSAKDRTHLGRGWLADHRCNQIPFGIREQLEPCRRPRYRAWRQHDVGCSTTDARPRPLLGPRRQFRAHRVRLDVAKHPEQLKRVIDRHAPEPTLIDGPRVPVPAVEVAGMSTRQPLHVRRNCVVPLRPEDEMPVVGHQHVGQQTHRDTLRRAAHEPQKSEVIARVLEQTRPSDAAIEHVVRVPARHQPSSSCHATTTANRMPTRFTAWCRNPVQ